MSPRRPEAPLERPSPPRVDLKANKTWSPKAGASAKALSAKRYSKFLRFKEKVRSRRTEAKGSSPSALRTTLTETAPPPRPPAAPAGDRTGASRPPTPPRERKTSMRNPLAVFKEFNPSDPPANVGRSSSPQRASTGNPQKKRKKHGKGKGKSKGQKGTEGSLLKRN